MSRPSPRFGFQECEIFLTSHVSSLSRLAEALVPLWQRRNFRLPLRLLLRRRRRRRRRRLRRLRPHLRLQRMERSPRGSPRSIRLILHKVKQRGFLQAGNVSCLTASPFLYSYAEYGRRFGCPEQARDFAGPVIAVATSDSDREASTARFDFAYPILWTRSGCKQSTRGLFGSGLS